MHEKKRKTPLLRRPRTTDSHTVSDFTDWRSSGDTRYAKSGPPELHYHSSSSLWLRGIDGKEVGCLYFISELALKNQFKYCTRRYIFSTLPGTFRMFKYVCVLSLSEGIVSRVIESGARSSFLLMFRNRNSSTIRLRWWATPRRDWKYDYVTWMWNKNRNRENQHWVKWAI